MIRVLFFLTFFCNTLFSHQTGLSYIDIQEDIHKKIEVIYKKPLGDINAKNLRINFPQNCQSVFEEPDRIENGFLIYKYSLWCGTKGLMSTRIWVEGLKVLNRGVIIHYKNPDISKKSLLKANTPYFYIATQSSSFTLFKEYVKLGIIHILSGHDHLLFVFALLLLATNLRILIIAISSFTLAHSITLVSAVYSLVNIPVVFVEAMIALSIVFLARELLPRNKNSLTKKHLEYIAFIFGLLHGFGFSNVLKRIGLPKDDAYLAIFSFNIGIELGQLLFILLTSLIIFMFKKYFLHYKLFLLQLFAYFIGSIATYWFFQRVSIF